MLVTLPQLYLLALYGGFMLGKPEYALVPTPLPLGVEAPQ
jgi:hypothetical protein